MSKTKIYEKIELTIIALCIIFVSEQLCGKRCRSGQADIQG